ncbi:glycoside hydrolase family 43 protein [Chitinophaga filiformis]|uniref:Alpha-N-arabinofuranosidase n=1 Tax=Chitinophaga filiformis TaxID=104663 RepID=A0A1G7XQ86_CHIFI|nr:glycoside hydrolase family 43 protein [Chitinophaga filiformis]SDG85800.1 alpha-N-arabinofuranosidase [Chitinophaga filiformis]
MIQKTGLFFLYMLLLVLPDALFAQQGYKNPVVRGFNPDPSICRVNDDFYLVTSSFEYFPGLPIYHSKDLVNWEQIGHCLNRESQLPLQKAPSSGGLYAPSIRYHKGKFYVICTNVSGGGNFYCTADNPAGPWSDPVWVGIKSIDPDIFWDDDDRSYFVTQGNEGIRITEIDIRSGKTLSPEHLVWAGTGGRFPEAPHVYRKDGYYYLLLGEGGTEYAHSTTIGRSKYLFGPYEACPLNPIITHCNRLGQGNPIQGVGHADLIQAPDSSWWAVFLGFRVTQVYSYYHVLGRETFLAPVSWPKDGWPQVNGNGIINIDMNVPTLPLHPFAKQATRVGFDSPALGYEWQYLRNPIAENYSLSERKGYLRISASPFTLNKPAALSLVARRQTEHDFTAETDFELVSSTEDEEAGITLMQNNTHHYDLLLKRKNGKYVVQLRVMVGSLSYIAAEQAVDDNKVNFRVKGSPLTYTFSYLNRKKGKYEELKKLDTRYLSTEVAGGFTGVMIGLYATSNGHKTTSKAYFDWFDYKVGE